MSVNNLLEPPLSRNTLCCLSQKLDLTTISTCCFPCTSLIVSNCPFARLQMPMLLHYGPFLRGMTCRCHPWLPQLFNAARNSSAVHEHRWHGGTAGTATQIVQKRPVSEAVPFRAHLLLPSLSKACVGSPISQQKTFI